MVEMEMSKRPASMAIVKKELQRILAQQMAEESCQVVKRRTFLRGCLSAVATCSACIAIATFIVEKPNVIDMLLAHPFTGTTPAHSLSPATPAQARLLSKPLYTYHGHAGSVTAVAWSPHGQYIASAGTLDSSVQVWDANTGILVIVPDLAMYPAEKKLLSRESVPALFATNGQRVDALSWSSDSIHLAAALGNDTVDSWSIETGDERLFRFSLPGNVNAVGWSPNGSRIAAVSGNTTVQVTSARTGRLFVTYTENAQAVLTLAWSPDGIHIASGEADVTGQVWNAPTQL